MHQENKQRSQISQSSILLRGIAKSLNITGSVLVASYDLSIEATKKIAYATVNSSAAIGSGLINVTRMTGSALGSGLINATKAAGTGLINATKTVSIPKPKKSKKLFDFKMDSVLGIFGRESDKIQTKIKEYEAKMHAIYAEIGNKKTSGASIGQHAEEAIDRQIQQARLYEDEIQRLKARLSEFKAKEAQAKESEKKKAHVSVKSAKTPIEQVERNIQLAIQKALSYGVFDSSSDRAIFEKVASDLLETEMEIKILAATELGKMGNLAATPILMETIKFDNTYLTTEVINSLINIGDVRAVPLFKAKLNDSSYRVRMGCIRGIYKLASDKEVVSTLVEALRDDHNEVRRTAVTFLGWKDDISVVPSLVQCLKDEDDRVRAATVSALLNFKDQSSVMPLIKVLGDKVLDIREKALEAIRTITGVNLSFDVQLSGQLLYDEINKLRDWWLKERFGDVDFKFEDDDELSKKAGAPIEEPVSTPIAPIAPIAPIEPIDTLETSQASMEEPISESILKTVQAPVEEAISEPIEEPVTEVAFVDITPVETMKESNISDEAVDEAVDKSMDDTVEEPRW
jgi:HEAT repeat protein